MMKIALMILGVVFQQETAETPDMRKSVVELPLKRALAAAEVEDGRVKPGLVAWHPSFEAAVEAAGKSGKPVLLFQLLGRLDEEFC